MATAEFWKTLMPTLDRTDKMSGMFPDDSAFLYNFITKHKCLKVLEVGMADGMSSVTILSALAENSKNDLGAEFKLTSIDPFQTTQWKSNGLKNVQKLNHIL